MSTNQYNFLVEFDRLKAIKYLEAMKLNTEFGKESNN